MRHVTKLDTLSRKFAFRVARADDLPQLVRMLADDPLGAARERHADPLPVGYIAAFEAIDRDPNQELIVAEIDRSIAGVVQLSFIPGLSYQGGWRALIEAVRVAVGHRSSGLGTAMIDYCIERARTRGCVLVQLTTDRKRDDALRFYERLGFVASHHGLKLRL